MLTDDQKAEIEQSLAGTSHSCDRLAEKFDEQVEEIEAAMANLNYERCPECDTWVESWELVDDDNELKHGCDSCKPRAGDD